MKKFAYLISIILIGVMVSCQSGNNNPKNVENDAHKVEVVEIIQASAYTYLKVNEGNDTYWMAVSRMNAELGDEFLYRGRLEMNDFESKDLDRVFDKIYFVEEIQKMNDMSGGAMDVDRVHSMMPKEQKLQVSLETPEGGISIAELFENKDNYNNQKVIVVGLVTKVNNGIMGKNWVHAQDGTDFDGKFDLVLTTNENIELGSALIFEGIVRTNKDFGSGYVYDVIIEEAVVK